MQREVKLGAELAVDFNSGVMKCCLDLRLAFAQIGKQPVEQFCFTFHSIVGEFILIIWIRMSHLVDKGTKKKWQTPCFSDKKLYLCSRFI